MDWTKIAWFIFGVFAGSWIGVLCMAMMFIAKDADRRMEEEYNAQLNESD